MKKTISKMSRLVIYLITTVIITPGVVFAHPGHSTEEQVHNFLHGEHILLLLGIIALLIAIRVLVARASRNRY